MPDLQPIRWGIIGPGTIAKTFAEGVANSTTGKLVAIATRNPDRPGLSEGFPGARIVNGYDALLSDAEIDAHAAAGARLNRKVLSPPWISLRS